MREDWLASFFMPSTLDTAADLLAPAWALVPVAGAVLVAAMVWRYVACCRRE